jgi:membrane protein YdbS with pleckstrin-like domain
MKIFSNFDTQFKQKVINKRLESFNESELTIISRSKYYFIFRVIFPLIFLLGIGIVMYIFLKKCNVSWYISSPLFFVWLLVVWFRVGHKFLKFLYDFTVVDPLGVTTYKQKWILHSFLKQIPGKRIRSIQIYRNSILENIFGYGSLDIHTDFSDNMHIGEEDEAPFVIWLTYVDSPYKIKNKITDLCFK